MTTQTTQAKQQQASSTAAPHGHRSHTLHDTQWQIASAQQGDGMWFKEQLTETLEAITLASFAAMHQTGMMKSCPHEARMRCCND